MDITCSTSTPAIVLPVQQVAPESLNSTPPVSPMPADPSSVQQDVGISDLPQVMNSGGILQQSWPVTSSQVPEEKDRRLHEKERQIEELMRKLEQEQKLVEALKMQLEVEKRATDSVSPKLGPVPAINPVSAVLNTNILKMESVAASSSPPSPASLPNSIPGTQALSSLPTVVKMEDVTVSCGKPLQLQSQGQLITQIQPQVTSSPQLCPQSQRSPKLQTKPHPPAPSVQQFFISHTGGVPQVLSQPQTLLTTSGQSQTLLTTTGQAGTQILLPVSLPNSATAIQLPSTPVSLQVRLKEIKLDWCHLVFTTWVPSSVISNIISLHLSLFSKLLSQVQGWSRPQSLCYRHPKWRRHPVSSWQIPASFSKSVALHRMLYNSEMLFLKNIQSDKIVFKSLVPCWFVPSVPRVSHLLGIKNCFQMQRSLHFVLTDGDCVQ